MPTNFGTGFGPSFGMSGWNNQQMTTPTKQQKFPGLSDDQIKRLESLTSNPQEQQKLYQQAIQQLKQQNTTDNRIAAENEMNYRSMNEKNPQQANYLQSNVRLEQLADLTKGAFGLDAGADTQQVVNGLMAMAQDNGVSLSLLNDYLDHGDEEFLYQMGLKQDPALQTNPDALSIKGSIANANEDKGEWNDNFFGRLETKGVEEGAGFWKNAGRFIGNVAKSGVNVLSDVGNMILNPLDTANALAKTAVGAGMNLLGTDEDIENMQDGKLKDWYMSANETADTVGQFFKERYGGGEEILNTLFTDPVGVVSDVASILEGGAGAVRGIAKGGAKGAAKAGLKGAARTLDNVAEGAGKVSRVAGTYDPYAVAMRAETQLPIKAISATVDVAKKVPGASAKMKNNLNVALDKAIGLDEKTKLAIQSNPFSKEVWQKAKTWIDANGLPEKSTEVSKQLITDVSEKVQNAVAKEMEKLGDTGPMYQPLKEAGFSVDLTNLKNGGLDEILTDYGIKIEDGKLDFSKSAIDGSEASNIKKIYDRVQDTNSPMPMNEYIDRFRKTISDMVNFNTNNKNALGKKLADTPGDKVLKSIRERANELAHEQVPALKDLDSAFTKQSELVKEITEGIVYKDKAKMGVVRDNIDQIVKNLDTNNRAQLKARLEKIIPGIEQEVKAINMLPKLIDNYYRPSKLQQKISGTAGAIIGTHVGGIPGGLLGAGAGYWLSNKIDKLKSRKRDKIISETSKDGADKLADIQNRIANNEKISQVQKAFLKEISQKLKEGKQVKEGEVMRIISDIMSAEEGKELAVLDKAISELETLGAKDEVKEWKKFREDMIGKMNEEAEMNRYAEEFEAEKQNIVNESADQRLPEFKRRIYQLGQEERRIGSVAGKKIGKNFEGKDYHRQQQTEWLRKKEAVIKEIQDYYNVDQFEASEIYDRIERQASADDVGFSKSQASSKTAKYQVANETITKDSSGKQLTKQQQDFFKGSKVVDKDGNLLRVYHGTAQPKEFTVFDNSKTNGYNSNSVAHIGNWFTDSKEGAGKFADTTWAGGKSKVMEGYLDIKNPKEYVSRDITEDKKIAGNNNKEVIKKIQNKFDELGFKDFVKSDETLTGMPSMRYSDKEFLKQIKYLENERLVEDYKAWNGYSKLGDFVGKLSKEGYSNTDIVKAAKEIDNLYKDYLKREEEYYAIQGDAYDQFKQDISKYSKEGVFSDSRESVARYKDELKKQGYDGIIIKDTKYDGEEFGGTNTQYVAFDSNQFKNIDNLDPTENPDIRFQKYGTAGRNEKGMTAAEGLNIRNFKNGKTVQELANQYGIDTKIVDSISTPEGQKAYGMYGDRLITLSKDLVESTVPHELLHGVFDIVDGKRKTSILEGIQKKLNVDNVQAEEWLADNFSEYYRTGKFGTKGLAKGLVEKVKQFFYEVKSYIDGTYKNEKQIRQLFDDIIDGKIEGEYGVYSDPKFQSVWHGSPYEFERFDSSNMGKGEGAQAHGWGHYVAKNKETGMNYATLKERRYGTYNFTIDGKPYKEIYKDLTPQQQDIFDSFKAIKVNDRTIDEAWKRVENEVDTRQYELAKKILKDIPEKRKANPSKPKEYYDMMESEVKSYIEYYEKYMDDVNSLRDRVGTSSNLYEVEIPDPIKKDTPTGSNYWEERDSNYTKEQIEKIGKELAKKIEGKPLEEATMKDVENIAKAMHNKLSPASQKLFVESVKEWVDKGHDIKTAIEDNMAYYTSLSSTADGWLEAAGLRPQGKYYDAIQLWRQGSQGRNIYTKISSILGGDKEASKFLESLGYDGIHYFGGRDGEAYVIFNDEALEITKHHKY